VLVEAGDQTVFFPVDLAPTSAHLPLPWIMGYDVEPLVTLETKREWLTRAGSEGWLMVFSHDPVVAVGVARPRDGRDGCELAEPRSDGADPVGANDKDGQDEG
jgi:glyoxylase-like metal-dependent hydrolase (beta-lactamase superfamily II)